MYLASRVGSVVVRFGGKQNTLLLAVPDGNYILRAVVNAKKKRQP